MNEVASLTRNPTTDFRAKPSSLAHPRLQTMEILLFKTMPRYQGRKVRMVTEDRAGVGRSDPDIIDGVARIVRIAQVRDVNETLPMGRKYEVVALTLRGKSVAEIASLLGISKSAVRAHLRRGARLLRGAIGGRSHDSDSDSPLSPSSSL